MFKKIFFLLIPLVLSLIFFTFVPKDAKAAILICDDGSKNCQLPACNSCPSSTNPGTCSISQAGACNVCTPNSNPGGSDCCSIGSPWSQYTASCRLTDPGMGTCEWKWVYDNSVCSTADKCLGGGSVSLNSGSCTCGSYGGQYKTCCNGPSTAACTNYSIQDNFAPSEGVCPGGSTIVFCGGAGQPACGQPACDTLKPDCNDDPVCTGSCSNAPSNTCSVGNGRQDNCEYTTYTGGGVNKSPVCKWVGAPNQPCDQDTCISGYSCVNGVCTQPYTPPPPPPSTAPNCNYGTYYCDKPNQSVCTAQGDSTHYQMARTKTCDGVTTYETICDHTQCPLPSTPPSASWSGSCSGTTFTISTPSGVTAAAVGIYTDGSGDAFNITAPGSATVGNGKNFNWYINGRAQSNYKGNATCSVTTPPTTSPELRPPPQSGPVSTEVIFRYPDGSDYDGYGLPAEGIPFYGTTACPQSSRFCGGYSLGNGFIYSLPTAGLKYEYSDYTRYGYHQYDFYNWPTCGNYNPDLWRYTWPKLPSSFAVTVDGVGGLGIPGGNWPDKCCGWKLGYGWEDYDQCYRDLSAANFCVDNTVIPPYYLDWNPNTPNPSLAGTARYNVSLCAGGWQPFLYFTLQPPTYLYVTQNAGGSVTYSYPGSGSITCTSAAANSALCPTTFRRVSPARTSNTYVTLTANPSSGYRFASWSNCSSSSGNTCYVYMDTNKSVTANFEAIPLRAITVTKVGTGADKGVVTGPSFNCGAGQITCSGSYYEGASVTLNASVPAADSQATLFTGWEDDCIGARATPNCDLTMNTAKNVLARFEQLNLCSFIKTTGGDVYAGRGITSPCDIP